MSSERSRDLIDISKVTGQISIKGDSIWAWQHNIRTRVIAGEMVDVRKAEMVTLDKTQPPHARQAEFTRTCPFSRGGTYESVPVNWSFRRRIDNIGIQHRNIHSPCAEPRS